VVTKDPKLLDGDDAEMVLALPELVIADPEVDVIEEPDIDPPDIATE